MSVSHFSATTYRWWFFVGTYRGSVDTVDPVVESTGVAQVVAGTISAPQGSDAGSTIDALLDIHLLERSLVPILQVGPRGVRREVLVGDGCLSLGECDVADGRVTGVLRRVAASGGPRRVRWYCVLIGSSGVADQGHLIVVRVGLRWMNFV